MTIAITFDSNAQLFHLTNGQISYLIEVIDKTYLAHCYFGQALPKLTRFLCANELLQLGLN